MTNLSTELKSGFESMFSVRGIESPPDESGSRIVWHRGNEAVNLISQIDVSGKIAKQELFCDGHCIAVDGQATVRVGEGSFENGVSFEIPPSRSRQRLRSVFQYFSKYHGSDPLLLHLKRAVDRAPNRRNAVDLIRAGLIAAPSSKWVTGIGLLVLAGVLAYLLMLKL